MKQSLKPCVLPAGTLGPDQDMLDRYVGFSSELLRLSLAGIAAVGFLITSIAIDARLWPLPPATATPVTISLRLLGTAAGVALLHRYVSTDAMAFHVCYLRMLLNQEEVAGSHERRARDRRLKLGGWALALAAIALGCGAIALAVALLGLLSLQPAT